MTDACARIGRALRQREGRAAQASEAMADGQHPSRLCLLRFLRGLSSQVERREVVRHLLAGCPTCSEYTMKMLRLADTPLLVLGPLERMPSSGARR